VGAAQVQIADEVLVLHAAVPAGCVVALAVRAVATASVPRSRAVLSG